MAKGISDLFGDCNFRWQLKYSRVATRFGLLAEACLALLLFPILRVMPLLRSIGIPFEASVRYHIWLGTSMIFFATFHGVSTLFIWGVSHHIQEEVVKLFASTFPCFLFLKQNYWLSWLLPFKFLKSRCGNGKSRVEYTLQESLLSWQGLLCGSHPFLSSGESGSRSSTTLTIYT